MFCSEVKGGGGLHPRGDKASPAQFGHSNEATVVVREKVFQMHAKDDCENDQKNVASIDDPFAICIHTNSKVSDIHRE